VHDMDGIVLADAALQPTPGEISTQDKVFRSLTSHQNALMLQSEQNITEDAQAHAVPPPPRPERP
ncbi:MAG: hypothetical protein ACRDFX_09200, partial [Chloroflexota bacterium]